MLPLLPIFLVGLPPMLLLSFLGFAGLVILGMLLICVGLSGGLDANNAFNEEVIVHGYARRSERALQASNLHSAIRFGTAHDGDRCRVYRRRARRLLLLRLTGAAARAEPMLAMLINSDDASRRACRGVKPPARVRCAAPDPV